jgi:GNAT superfamily N-acetyltransferase
MDTIQIFRTPEVATPDEGEVAAFFRGLDNDARRFMPVDASEILDSPFLAWAREGDRIAGLAGCIRRKGLLFLHIAVAEDVRGKGLGRVLLSEVLAFGRRRRAAIYLSVHAENEPAVRLYQQEGFKVVAREPGRYWMMCPTTRGGAALCAVLQVIRPLLSWAARLRARRRRAR